MGALLGRSDAEGAAVTRILEKNWFRTAADLSELRESEWTALGLPVKFESVLRTYIDGGPLPIQRHSLVESQVPNPSDTDSIARSSALVRVQSQVVQSAARS